MATTNGATEDRAAPGRRRGLLLDGGLALAAFGLSLVLLAFGSGPNDRDLDALGVVLAGVASLPLLARRRAPLEVFALTAGASVALVGIGYPPGPPIGATIALFFLALGDRRHGRPPLRPPRRRLENRGGRVPDRLGEIDQLVRALREDGPEGRDGDGAVEPPPGLEVEVRARGARRPLPPGLDQAAYRIVQEALTNAARHGAGRAEVDIAFTPSTLELVVTNPTRPGASTAGGGHGIVGMRERAALLGGSLEAGPQNGSFRVLARLPYGEGG